MFRLLYYFILSHIKRKNTIVNKKYYKAIMQLKNYYLFMHSKIGKENIISIPKKNFSHINLHIETTGNNINIKKNPSRGFVNINIIGKDCNLVIGDLSSVIGNININIKGNNTYTEIGTILVGTGGLTIHNGITIDGIPSEFTTVIIGSGSSFEECTICSYHHNTSVTIGENCMFSGGIYVMGSDTHPIYNYETKEICNKTHKGIAIGNHCWIGSSATILKNVSIPDDCIIGWGAIVTKSFKESHCAIAGTPAKIVKHNVTWKRQDSKLYTPIA